MSVCEQCGNTFSCAMREGKDSKGNMPCWCTALPKLAIDDMPAAAAVTRSCLCPDCLRAWIAAKKNQ